MSSPTEAEWLTWPQAAVIVGCSVAAVDYHKRTGRIRHRTGQQPSLDATSMQEFAVWWRDHDARKRDAPKPDKPEPPPLRSQSHLSRPDGSIRPQLRR